ncbi:MAG: hypothetical protein ACK559_15510, partial [bacterium]
ARREGHLGEVAPALRLLPQVAELAAADVGVAHLLGPARAEDHAQGAVSGGIGGGEEELHVAVEVGDGDEGAGGEVEALLAEREAPRRDDLLDLEPRGLELV